jgi:hypothetical protein
VSKAGFRYGRLNVGGSAMAWNGSNVEIYSAGGLTLRSVLTVILHRRA